MEPVDGQKFEQCLASMRDTQPRMWLALYQGALDAGFDKFQAFALLQTWILSQNPNGIRPPDGAGPETDKDN